MKTKINILSNFSKHCTIGSISTYSTLYASIVGMQRGAYLALLILATCILINTTILSKWPLTEDLTKTHKTITSAAGQIIGIASAIITLRTYSIT